MSKQFPYFIEDWILWMASKRDDLGNEIDFSYYRKPPIKLANYDVSFINRSADGIERGMGFTERQLHAAAKIIAKYQRQIVDKINKDPVYLTETDVPPHRLAVREVDRSFSVRKHQNYYEVRFPYNPVMVDAMHKLSAHSTGDYNWNKSMRCWHVGLTEPNLALLRDFVRSHKNHSWSVDAETRFDFANVDSIRADELAHVPYLDLNDHDKLTAFNTNPHLKAALDADFDWNQDLVNAAFRADNYGLRVGPKLTNHIKTHYSNIHKAVLATQAEIFTRSKSLDTNLRINDLEQFMKTIHADRWIFVSFEYGAGLSVMAEEAINIEVPGEKLFYHNSGTNKFDFFEELKGEDMSNTVVFTDGGLLISRVVPSLLSRPLLRTIYLYGHKYVYTDTDLD